MKKRSFLLLEILIALMLVIICIVPLILEPFLLYRTEMKLLEEVEGERLADWTFSEIKEKLLKNEIPWKALPTKNGEILTYPLNPMALQIPGRMPKVLQRKFTLKCRREKRGLQGEIYRIFDVNIYFRPRVSNRQKKKNKYGEKKADYYFKITVRQIPSNEQKK